MTSGTFVHFPIGKITVDRANRQRKTVTEEAVADLADSIRRKGLIHPIVIRKSGDLVAGETRLAACKVLGWTTIAAQYVDDLPEHEIKEIELEENVKRYDLPWQDKCLALYALDLLYHEQDGSWTQAKTAEAIGYSTSFVEKQLLVAKELLSGNEMVKAAPVFSTAKGITERKLERARVDEAIIFDKTIPDEEKEPEVILIEDFNKWSKTYDGPPFNLLHCDFPYGIGADKFDQGAAKSFGGYADTEEGYWGLVKSLLDNRKRLLGESAHILFWFSPRHYSKTLEALRSAFWVDDYPLIWNKVNIGIIPDPNRGPRRIYEMAFFCSHGDRKIVRPISNLTTATLVRTGAHMSEKSEDMLKHFFQMVVDGQTRMLDPTCGSGSSLRAAKSLGAASVLGLEIDPEFAKNARVSLRSSE